jgi:hypothetical protein
MFSTVAPVFRDIGPVAFLEGKSTVATGFSIPFRFVEVS